MFTDHYLTLCFSYQFIFLFINLHRLSFFVSVPCAGANVDANVVFSQESYVPRSATFNFTTDLFGHSLNLLEVRLFSLTLSSSLSHNSEALACIVC